MIWPRFSSRKRLSQPFYMTEPTASLPERGLGRERSDLHQRWDAGEPWFCFLLLSGSLPALSGVRGNGVWSAASLLSGPDFLRFQQKTALFTSPLLLQISFFFPG